MEFTIKDSGKREEFKSGMVRDTQEGKLRFDLAMDGPLFWALFANTKYGELVNAARVFYEEESLEAAAQVVHEFAKLDSDGLWNVLAGYTEHLMKGAIKYSERNWMKASGEEEAKRFKCSFGRHFSQVLRGDLDEDHRSATLFNMNGLLYVRGKGPLAF